MNIRVNNATKYIRGSLILNSVTMDLKGGKIYGLKGPNGSGKTMVMRLIGGLIYPTSGEILIDGQKLGSSFRFSSVYGIAD